MRCVEPIIDRVSGHFFQADLGGVLSVSLFGSAAVNGLCPESDVDVLVLAHRSQSRFERQDPVEFLLQFSTGSHRVGRAASRAGYVTPSSRRHRTPSRKVR